MERGGVDVLFGLVSASPDRVFAVAGEARLQHEAAVESVCYGIVVNVQQAESTAGARLQSPGSAFRREAGAVPSGRGSAAP